jgi:hypothetical protein
MSIEPIRLDKVKNPHWRPRLHKYDCFRTGLSESNIFAGLVDFGKDYKHPKLTKPQLKTIVREYFKQASIDIIQKNEIFHWPGIGKIFIGKYKPKMKHPFSLINTEGYAFRFYFQRESQKGTLKHYNFRPTRSVNRKNKPEYGLSGLKRWVFRSIWDPTLYYDAIFMGKR